MRAGYRCNAESCVGLYGRGVSFGPEYFWVTGGSSLNEEQPAYIGSILLVIYSYCSSVVCGALTIYFKGSQSLGEV